MNNLSDIFKVIPPMLCGQELVDALTVLPEYHAEVCGLPASERLTALSNLYQVYLPSQMSLEIYSKLYLALLRSLQKKGTKLAVRQQNQNRKAVLQQEYGGILGGSDSFTIIGTSGIGKSSAINRAIYLITQNRVVQSEDPYAKITPCVVVQCPFDASVKGLLLEVMRKVDEVLDSRYYQNAVRARATTDMLIGSVSQVALHHIGMLVVDEIQNVANSKNGKSLIGALTQLINNSGIAICMVGTPDSISFFQSAMQLARRSVGLQYNAMSYDGYFQNFCKLLFQYQYVKMPVEMTAGILEWLYEHSAGIASVVVTLIHDAQEIAILNGTEILSLDELREAYERRLSLMHGYIQPSIVHNHASERKKKVPSLPNPVNRTECVEGKIAKLVTQAKREGTDIVQLMKSHVTVEEVAI